MTKEQALDQLMALKDYYESQGLVFILCLEDSQNEGAWLFYNRLQESKTKQLTKTVENNVNIFFQNQREEVVN